MGQLADDYKEVIREFTKSLSLLEKVNPSLGKEFKDILDKLKDFTEKLTGIERLSILGRIISATCHELRNPMGAINTAAYFILTNIGKDNPKLAKHAGIIQQEVESAARIMDSVSSFYKAMELNLVSSSINTIIEDVITETEKRMPEKKVNILKDLGPTIPRLMVDVDRLGRAIGNILQNSLDSVDKGGEIRISTRFNEDRLLIVITDNGCGIPEENIDKVFDPTFSTKASGIGLGLTLAREIIEKHNGSIKIESQPNKGTRVSITLPVETR